MVCSQRFWMGYFVLGLLVLLPALALAQQSPPAEGDEADLIVVLKSDAEIFDKAKACQRLAVIGTKESVPVLVGMLTDEKLAHYARYALEPNPDESVDAAFREALGKLDGLLKVGVINSIGVRGDTQAVDLLIPMLDDDDSAVAGAAATTLARLKTPAAVQAILKALPGPDEKRNIGSKACLIAADEFLRDDKAEEALAIYEALGDAAVPAYVKIAALHGAIRAKGDDGLPMMVAQLKADDRAKFRVALAMAHEWGSGEVVAALLENMGDLPADRKALVIYTLGDLNDKAALPVVIQTAKSGLDDVRVAAIRVLATLGDASAVPVLLETAVQSQGDLAKAAQASLAVLPGEEIDQTLAAQLEQAEGDARVMIINLVGQRGMSSAVPALLKAVDADDAEVRMAAIDALGRTVGLDDLPVLIRRLVERKTDDAAAAAKEALRKACMRTVDRNATAEKLLAAMEDVALVAKSDLLDLLGVVGGETALAGVADAAKTGSEDVQNAATRVLGEWLDTTVAPVLLELSKTGPEKYRIRALRGYIRIIRQFGDLSNAERLEMAQIAMAASDRDDERRLVLDAITRVPTPPSMRMMAESFEDPAVREAVCAALVSVAGKIVDKNPRIVADMMGKVVQATENPDLKGKAQVLLNRANNKL